MWRRVPCEQPLHTGQSILSPRRNPMLMVVGCSLYRFRRERVAFPATGRAHRHVSNSSKYESRGLTKSNRRFRKTIRVGGSFFWISLGNLFSFSCGSFSIFFDLFGASAPSLGDGCV